VLVRVVVITSSVMDLATWVAALDLDRSVANIKFSAEAALQVPHHMLRIAERAIAHHDVAAERGLI
jgi:hypothetical protein